jgi:hypothetical protein
VGYLEICSSWQVADMMKMLKKHAACLDAVKMGAVAFLVGPMTLVAFGTWF